MSELMERARAAMVERNLRVIDVAASTGLDEKTVRNALAGRHKTRRTTERLIATALGIVMPAASHRYSQRGSDAA